MFRIVVFIFVLIFPGVIQAKVFFQIYDSNTLVLADPNHVHVDQNLSIKIRSDSSEQWSGYFFIAKQDPEPDTPLGSLLSVTISPAVGSGAQTFPWEDSIWQGFELYTGSTPSTGEWFNCGYAAISTGESTLVLYDETLTPLQTITLHQFYPSDTNNDDITNFKDYGVIAAYWDPTCQTGSMWQAADLNSDGKVDFYDLRLLAEYWLK